MIKPYRYCNITLNTPLPSVSHLIPSNAIIYQSLNLRFPTVTITLNFSQNIQKNSLKPFTALNLNNIGFF